MILDFNIEQTFNIQRKFNIQQKFNIQHKLNIQREFNIQQISVFKKKFNNIQHSTRIKHSVSSCQNPLFNEDLTEYTLLPNSLLHKT